MVCRCAMPPDRTHEDRFLAPCSSATGFSFLSCCSPIPRWRGHYYGPRSYTRRADRIRHLHVRPHGDVPDQARLYDEDGGGAHDLNLHGLHSYRDHPAPDGTPRLRTGAATPPEPLVFPLRVLLISIHTLQAKLKSGCLGDQNECIEGEERAQSLKWENTCAVEDITLLSSRRVKRLQDKKKLLSRHVCHPL